MLRRSYFTRRRSHLFWMIVPLLVVALGCGQKAKQETAATSEKTTTTTTAETATPVDASTAGTVTGKILFSGTALAMQPIDSSSEPVCHTKSESHPLMTETAVVNPNGTLRYVFVYVKEGLGDRKFPVPTTPVTLNQEGCRYEPHVFGIQVGQPLKIVNSDDGVLHNIHALSTSRNGFNFGMPKLMETTKEFKAPEVMVRVKCDVHGWMHAFGGVLEHPYYSVSGQDGTYAISGLPPGQYVIEAWHEQYGTKTETVTVGAQETKEINFTFAPTS